MLRSIESIDVQLTPDKYLDSRGRYLRSKLTNNELEGSDTNLEILHDKFNDNDPLALEVFCNQIFIGHIQKYDSTVDIDDFCFSDSNHTVKLCLDWKNNGFVLTRRLAESTDSNSDDWMYRFWKWADKYDIDEEYLPRSKSELLSIESLSIDDRDGDITSIPRDIRYLTNLRYLTICCRNLTEIPKEIGYLTKLEIVHLYNCQLESLPREIGNLTKLTSLILSHNKLAKLPHEIGRLTQLRELLLDDNKLKKVPNEIGDLSNLEYLELTNNKLKSIPKEIGKLSNLDRLQLKRNSQLSYIPEEISDLTQLRGLNLEGTDIDSLPESIENLPNLIGHDDYGRRITFLPRDKPTFGFNK